MTDRVVHILHFSTGRRRLRDGKAGGVRDRMMRWGIWGEDRMWKGLVLSSGRLQAF
jgi:hypothetical protein